MSDRKSKESSLSEEDKKLLKEVIGDPIKEGCEDSSSDGQQCSRRRENGYGTWLVLIIIIVLLVAIGGCYNSGRSLLALILFIVLIIVLLGSALYSCY